MKITCDNCGAVYRIPEEKLTKDVSRATCKKCGAKLIIRRPGPGEEGYEDARLGGGADEDSVINHEERTVIAQVPELQKFDAVPPLAGSAAPQEMLGLLGNATGGSAAPSANVRTTQDTTLADEPRKIGQAGRSPAQPSRPSTPVAPVGPSITAATSPIRPSGEPAAPPPPPPPPPRQAQGGAVAATSQKANVVDIFSQQSNKPAAQEFRTPASNLSLVLMGLSLVGVLMFVDEALWGYTRLTAVGFILSVYGISAAFLAQWDLVRNGRINFVKVFLIPAVIVVVLLTALWTTQKDNLAFLKTGEEYIAIREEIRDLLSVPEAQREEVRLQRKEARRQGGGRRAGGALAGGPALPSGEIPAITGTAGAGADTGLGVAPKTGAEGPSTAVKIDGTDISLPMSRSGRTAVKLPSDTREEVQLDEVAIVKALDAKRIRTCLDTHATGLDIPSVVVLDVKMKPDGSPMKAEFAGSPVLNGTQLEKCMQDKVRQVRFPSFDGAVPQTYAYKIVR